MDDYYDQSKNWHYYLTRPFNLFGASLWNRWYCSPETRSILGAEMHKVLFIEESRDVFRQYRTLGELGWFTVNIALNHLVFHPGKTKLLLEQGIILNERAAQAASKNTMGFQQIEDAVSFYTKLAIHATILPSFTWELASRVRFGFRKIKNLSEQLRAKSYYLQVFSEAVVPLAKMRLRQSGVQDVDSAVTVITYDELLAGEFSEIASRQEAKCQGQFFVYQNNNGVQTINWIKDPHLIINKIESRLRENLPDEVSGRIAFHGSIAGHVKVIMAAKDWLVFNKGDILVAPSTNPALLPIIQKAGAIVTDEGGITCHAAIISRELKIPCIIGTKIATKVFKDGDLVEVDANRGIVKLIK